MELDELCAELAKAIFPHNNDTNSRLRVERAASALVAAIAPPNITPESEPDQDTLDTVAIIHAWENIEPDVGTITFDAAKRAFVEIKERVRKEAIAEHIEAQRQERLRMQGAQSINPYAQASPQNYAVTKP